MVKNFKYITLQNTIHVLQTNLCTHVRVRGSCIHTHSQTIKQIRSLIHSKCNHITSRFQHNQEVKVQFCTAGTSCQLVKAWWLYLPHRYCHQYFATSNHSSGHHLLTIYLHIAQKAVSVSQLPLHQ